MFDHFASTATTHTDGTEDNLYSDTIAANEFGTDGDGIKAEYVVDGLTSNAGDDINVYFAGTLIGTGKTAAVVNWLEVMLIRESSTVVRCAVVLGNGATAPITTYTRLTSLTLSGTNILKITGVAHSGAITCRLGKIYKLPRAA